MSIYYLTFALRSDALFGRGDGVAGLIDQEVQHDEYGCPFLGGRALKGMLVNECADILAALSTEQQEAWGPVAQALFGSPGSLNRDGAVLAIDDARLPDQLRNAIKQDIDSEYPTLTRSGVLSSLTTIRRQTAMDSRTGMPKDETLRSLRLVLRETSFEARIEIGDHLPQSQSNKTLMLLSACVKALRRVGTGRNRGHGRLHRVELRDNERNVITQTYFDLFRQEVCS